MKPARPVLRLRPLSEEFDGAELGDERPFRAATSPRAPVRSESRWSTRQGRPVQRSRFPSRPVRVRHSRSMLERRERSSSNSRQRSSSTMPRPDLPLAPGSGGPASSAEAKYGDAWGWCSSEILVSRRPSELTRARFAHGLHTGQKNLSWGGWIRTIIAGFKVPRPAFRRRPSSGGGF